MGKPAKISVKSVNLRYGSFHALDDLTFDIPERSITAIIGPSGCGKSTTLRLFNRMNDLIPGCNTGGSVFIGGEDVYDKDYDVVTLRKKVGMVFQKPNVFPMSILENITMGPKRHGIHGKQRLSEIAERCLSQVALWDEVKELLRRPALSLAVGQQQRLCIARALAVEPEVILMDESCSALDPESTMKIEDLMQELKKEYTIVTVTHNMEQAARVSDMSAFMMIDEKKVGKLHKYCATDDMFFGPQDSLTTDYITGRFG